MTIRIPRSGTGRKIKTAPMSSPLRAEAHASPSIALDELLTVNDVAKLLKLSERHVRRLISTGALASCHLGRAVRVHRFDVDAYVSARRRAARGVL